MRLFHHHHHDHKIIDNSHHQMIKYYMYVIKYAIHVDNIFPEKTVKRDMLSVVNRKLYNVSVPSVGKFSPEKTIYCDIKEIATLATSKPPQHAQHILLIKNKVSYFNNIYNMQSFLNIYNIKRIHKPLNRVSEYSIDVHSNLILYDLNHTKKAY